MKISLATAALLIPCWDWKDSEFFPVDCGSGTLCVVACGSGTLCVVDWDLVDIATTPIIGFKNYLLNYNSIVLLIF